MTRGDHAARRKIKAPVSTVISRVTKKNTGSRAAAEFVRGRRGLIRITQAPEHAEMVIRGRNAKKTLEWCDRRAGVARTEIKKVCCRRQCLCPERKWQASMNEECPNAIVHCANDPLGLAILRRSIWARQAHCNPVCSKILPKGLIIELSTVV